MYRYATATENQVGSLRQKLLLSSDREASVVTYLTGWRLLTDGR